MKQETIQKLYMFGIMIGVTLGTTVGGLIIEYDGSNTTTLRFK